MTLALLDPQFKANMISQLDQGTGGTSLAARNRDNSLKELLSSVASITPSVPTTISSDSSAALGALLVNVLGQIAIVDRYFEPSFKDALIKHVHRLLDPEDWDQGDPVPSANSFQTLLRLLISINPERQPGLGIAPSGNFVAAWHDGEDRIFIETAKNDLMKWVLSRTIDTQKERVSGEAKIHRFFDVTNAWKPEGYITHAINNNRK